MSTEEEQHDRKEFARDLDTIDNDNLHNFDVGGVDYMA